MNISPVNTMTVSMAVTADQYAVCVRMAGDVDLAAEPDLARLAEDLAATRCSHVHIDLQPITFAGSTLINFLFRLARHTSVTLCRPGTITRQLIELTGLNELATVRADLPADWTASSARANEGLEKVAAWASSGVEKQVHLMLELEEC